MIDTMESAKCNTRLEEFDFLISIMSDLAHKYPNHNERLLEELISNLKYRRENEKTTVIAKHKSEEYQKQKHKS